VLSHLLLKAAINEAETMPVFIESGKTNNNQWVIYLPRIRSCGQARIKLLICDNFVSHCTVTCVVRIFFNNEIFPIKKITQQKQWLELGRYLTRICHQAA
jgi:hypothetical protein